MFPEPSEFMEEQFDMNTEDIELQSADDPKDPNELASKIDFLMSFINKSKDESYCGKCKTFFPQLSTSHALKRHLEKVHSITTNHPYMCPVDSCSFSQGTKDKVTLLNHVDTFHLGGYFQKNILSQDNQTFESYCDGKVELVIDLDDDDDEPIPETENYDNTDDYEVIVFKPEEDDDEYL